MTFMLMIILQKTIYQKLKSNELEKFIYNHNFYYGTALTKSFEKLGYQTKNIIEDNYLGNNKWFEENYGKSNISYDEKLLRRIKNFNQISFSSRYDYLVRTND